MKLRLTTTENKYFVTLAGMFNMYCSSLFFFPVIDLCSFFYSIFALFIQRFSLLFIYSTILVSHFFFFFFLVFCLYFYFPFIYITIHPVFLHCVRTIAATVLWFRESFLFFSFFSSFSVIGLCFFFFF